VLLSGIGFVDYLTGFEISISLFYLIPIGLITWFVGKRLGLFFAAASALAWSAADLLSRNAYSHPVIYFWNTAVRLGFYIIVAWLLSSVKRSLDIEKELARTDSLTGAVNARFFSTLLQGEINRSRRYNHPFTLIYMDLDNFKHINDQFGHSTGDRVLSELAGTLKLQLRRTDVIARLGGDEFAVLLPETGDDAARSSANKIYQNVIDLMQRKGWSITVSMGTLVCLDAPVTGDEAIRLADDLMYTAKNDGKNGIKYSIYQENLRMAEPYVDHQ
jgi:diguanylate cyclase (GGDEF)-like protein